MPWSGYLDRYGFTKKQKIFFWKVRSKFLKANPICAFCTSQATIVDHIRPHKGNWILFMDMKNFQSLCKPCHDSKKQIIERNSHKREVGEDGFYKD
jgi:5-methylcytosine-specific restriction endonuclease McrA